MALFRRGETGSNPGACGHFQLINCVKHMSNFSTSDFEICFPAMLIGISNRQLVNFPGLTRIFSSKQFVNMTLLEHMILRDKMDVKHDIKAQNKIYPISFVAPWHVQRLVNGLRDKAITNID